MLDTTVSSPYADIVEIHWYYAHTQESARLLHDDLLSARVSFFFYLHLSFTVLCLDL
jgi:hypothetical protein